MVILDIDADFFFYPIFYDLITEEDFAKIKSKMKQTKKLEEVLQKFKIKWPERYKIFDNHDAVYYVMSGDHIIADEMVHIDAHSDLGTTDKVNTIGRGNFIFHLFREGLVKKVIWLYQDESNYKFEEKSVLGRPFIQMKFSDFETDKQIDYVFFSLSKVYCLENDLAEQFDSYMQSLIKRKTFIWKYDIGG